MCIPFILNGAQSDYIIQFYRTTVFKCVDRSTLNGVRKILYIGTTRIHTHKVNMCESVHARVVVVQNV